jgi:Domain of unknown function (DUF4303)
MDAGAGVMDWDAKAKLLIAESEIAMRTFMVEHDTISLQAVGYWCCVGIGYVSPPPFAINANPRAFYETELAKAKAAQPDFRDAEMRWNSGYFKYPACVELGAAVTEMTTELNDAVSAGTLTATAVNAGMIDICCRAMADLARKGVFGNPDAIDFVIQTANDSWYENEMAEVQARHQEVRRLIGAGV